MLHIWGYITSDCPYWPPSTMETTSYEWKKVALSDKWCIILPDVWGSVGTRKHYRKKAKLAMFCLETLDPCGIDLHSPRKSEKLDLWFTCRDKFNRSPKPNPFPLLGASLGVSWCVTSIMIRLPALVQAILWAIPSHSDTGTVPRLLKHACKNRNGDRVWCPVQLRIRSCPDWIQAAVIIITWRWKSKRIAGIWGGFIRTL